MHTHRLPAVLRLAAGCGLLVAVFAGCTGTRGASGIAATGLTPAERDEARAIAHYAQGLIEEQESGTTTPVALSHFLQAAELDPGHHRLYAKSATGLLLNDRPAEAVALLERSTRELPDSFLAWVDLATAYQWAANMDAALHCFRKAMAIDPARTDVYLAIATIEFDRGHDREALKALAEGIADAADPTRLRSFAYRRGLQFIDEKASARSLPCFQFVVEHADSNHAQIYFLMGQLYEGLGLVREASESYALAAREEPPVPMAYIKLALLAFKGNPEEALAILDQAQARLPDDLLIPFAKGQMLSSQGRYGEAIPAFSSVARILEGQPGVGLPASFYLHYGAAYERSGDYARAEEVFEACIERYPEAHEVLNYLAYMWADQNTKLQRALTYVQRALKQEPRNGAYLDTLGWVYYRLGRLEEAARMVADAQGLEPGDPTISDHLGDIWSALGDHPKALRHWKDSYLRDAENDKVASKLRASGVDLESLLLEAAPQPASGSTTDRPAP